MALLAELPHGTLYHGAVWTIVAAGGTDAIWLRLPSLLALAGSVIVSGHTGRGS